MSPPFSKCTYMLLMALKKYIVRMREERDGEDSNAGELGF